MSNKKLNIMQIVHCMDVAGAERVVCSIVKNLSGERFSFSICCLDYIGKIGEQLMGEGVNVFELKRKPGMDFRLIKRLAGMLKDQRVDIVHAHQYTPYFYGAIAAILSQMPKIIFTEHGRHQPDKIRPKRVICNRFLNPFTSMITGVSNFSKDSLVRYERLPGKRIDVIYNGIETTEFNNGADREAKRKELGINSADIAVGMIGRFAPVKNHRMLLSAFKDVLKVISNIKLILAGDGALKKECAEFTLKLGMQNNVSFLGRRSDIPALLSAFDIYVLPSIAEAASLTLLEAMAAGLPVVAMDAGGNPEIVLNDRTGILVSPGDSAGFSKAIITLAQDPEKRKRLGSSGKKRSEEMFTMDMMLAKYEELYIGV